MDIPMQIFLKNCSMVLRLASVPAAPDWAMRRELMSQSYTTKVDQLWTVKAR